MNSKEISVWLEERWYNALTAHLVGESVESRLQAAVDEMCSLLPQAEFDRISCEIESERRQEQELYEANRRFSIFHIKENGSETHLLVNEQYELLIVSMRLREYLKRNQPSQNGFADRFSNKELLSQEQYQKYVDELIDNTGRVIGVFDIDFEKDVFSILSVQNGWESYLIKDITTAAYHAYRKADAPIDMRRNILCECLSNKALVREDITALPTIRAVVIEPKKKPQVKRSDPSLTGLQSLVGGNIQAIYPYEDLVAIL